MYRALSFVLFLSLVSSAPVYAAVLAAQDFDAVDASATFTSDQLPDGSQLTNASSMSSGPGIGFASFWFDTRGEGAGPITGTETGDFIGANAFGGANAPDVGATGVTVSSGVEQNFEFNDPDGRIDLVFDVVDLSEGMDRTLTLNYWIAATGYEADDLFLIQLSDDVDTVELLRLGEPELEAQASADDGSANWQSLTVDLEPFFTAGTISDQVRLIVSVDTNSGSENVFIDNIAFEEGAAPPPAAIVINEIMQNPSAVSDGDGEWFELLNNGSTAVDLEGYVVRDDGSDQFTINAPLPLGPGEFAVLGVNGDMATNGGVAVDFAYSGMFLANGDDELVLLNPAMTEVDRVAWDGGPLFPDPTGASMFLLDPAADNADGSNWQTSSSLFGDGDLGTPGAVNDSPTTTVTLISDIQGTGGDSPLLGQTVSVEAVIVGDFQDDLGADGDVNGIYLQEEDADADADPATSEGIFVFEGNDPTVDLAVGDLVQVTGTVSEFFGETQISASSISVVSSGNTLPTAASLSLPLASSRPNADNELIADLEAYEGMRVEIPQTLFVTELFNLDRFGEMRLASDMRLFQFTNSNLPDGPGFLTHLDTVARSNVMLDDGLLSQNPDPIRFPAPGLDSSNPVRMGDGVTGLTGVVRFSRGSGGSGDELYRILPTTEPVFETLNTRPPAPPLSGSLRVASLNVLNYFNDLDDGTGQCFPSFTDDDCRGADSEEEFARQQAKLVSSLVALDADVIALVEIENDYPDGATSSIADLAAALNAAAATTCNEYGYADPGGRIGDDAIAVGMLLCNDTVRVAPGTVPAVLTDAALPGLELGDLLPVFDGVATNRAPLAVTIEEIATGELVTIAVNHFKSKGASGLDATATCMNDPASDLNCDQSDGQAFWSLRRTSAAFALLTWLETAPTGSNDPDVLVTGDLNAYRFESPLVVFSAFSFSDLLTAFDSGAGEPYSFVFDGQAGVLDHALASTDLLPQVQGAAVWHSNADEADGLDYNLDFGRNPTLFDGSSPYRASDHDPVVVGLALASTPTTPTIASIIAQVDAAIEAGTLEGSATRPAAADRRLRRFQQLLQRALAAEQTDNNRRLCKVLPILISRSNGIRPPADLVKGIAVAEINASLFTVALEEGCRL